MKHLPILFAVGYSIAFTVAGQTPAAKPDGAKPKVEAKEPAPKIETAKIWRLLATLQSMQAQLRESPMGKQVAEAQAAFDAEQQKIAGQCSAKGYVLGTADAKADNAGDLACVLPPPPPADAKGK
jgi:hypothetical protein